MSEEDLNKFEKDAEKALDEIDYELPVSEVRILSPKVLPILLKNALKGEVTYSAAKREYSVVFAFAEVRQDDGNLGMYVDLPPDMKPEDAETIAFRVKGFLGQEETEVQFAEGKILLNRTREHGHIINFQRAVLQKGMLN